MPIYTYKCPSCNRSFEETLSIANGEKRLNEPCPGCGATSLVRPPATPALHMRYSPMHPRQGRGRGRYLKKKTN